MRSKTLKKAGAAIMSAAMLLNGAVTGASVVTAADSQKYEFEDAVLDGVTVTDFSGASGGACARMETGGSIALTVTVDATDMYTMTIYAGGIGSAKQQNLSVNGAPQGALAIPESDGFEAISIPVKLTAGENTILIEASWGWTNFDYLTIETATLPEIKATQTAPTDQLATVETQSLMAYLAEVYGKNIISGQQEIYSGGPHGLETEFEYLYDLTGHYPAIRGFDYGNFCCPAYGSDDGSTKRVIDWVKNRGGIATASFHLNVPTKFESYTIGDKIDWAQTTYTQNTDFSPSKAATPGTKENEYYMQSLEILAKEFNKLEAEGIPVIWRPLHEAEGGGGETGSWFWWGREGSEAYKKLWIYTYETLTDKFDCHNLIWEWNSYDFATSANWYPGDAYVDIIGYDKYNCTDWSTGSPKLVHNDSAISSTFYNIMERYDSAKMVAMAENDCFSTVENLTSEKAGWLYFCTWYDGGSPDINFLSDPVFNTKEDTIEMYQSEYCITLDELPKDLYNREGVTPPDPAKTTTTTTTATTTADPNATTTTTAYKFEVSKYPIELPEGSKATKALVMTFEGAPGASIGGGVGYSAGPTPADWKNLEWSGNIGTDGTVTIDISLSDVPDDVTSAEAQIWWSNVWDAVNEVGIDQPCKMVSYEVVEYGLGDNVEPDKYGDANCDGEVDIADAVLIMQALSNPDNYGLKGANENHITELGEANADCDGSNDGMTNNDALAIQMYLLSLIDELPGFFEG